MWYIKTLAHSLILYSLGLSTLALGLTIGSDTVPSRESIVEFPTETDNIILGYAAMAGGFSLADNATTVSFNSYFPVNSVFGLNDGSVYLLNDLMLAGLCDCATTGSIHGNGYTVSWLPQVSEIKLPSTAEPAGSFYFDNVNITFNASVQLQSSLYFNGNCMVDGQGYTMNLGEESINVTGGSSLLIKNLVIKGLAGSNIQCLDSQSVLSLQHVTCQLSADYTFGEGMLEIIDNVLMEGAGSAAFIYSTSQQSVVYADATWFFDSGMTFNYDPANGAPNLLNFQNSQAIFHLYETSFYAPSTGLQLTKGTLVVQGECPIFSSAENEENGIIIGDGIAQSNDMDINILPESGLDVMSGYLVNKNLSDWIEINGDILNPE